MRLLMYRHPGEPTLGVLQEDSVVDVQTLGASQGLDLPATMLALIDAGEAGLDRLQSALWLENSQFAEVLLHPLSEVEILAPLDPPRGNVLCIGRNYLEHAEESARARGEEVLRPTVFTKAQTAINSPYGDIVFDPALSREIDWEAELGVVIGRRARDVSPEEALDYVFGYTVLNDVSARDIQFGWGGQFFKGKSLDGFCPVGPWIVTRDEIPDPQNLHVLLRVNGEIRQDASTHDMIFSVADIVSQLSTGMTLLPGSLIATGTPSGVGMGRTPPVYLRDGDVMETAIDGIGLLRNRVRAL